MGYIRLRRRYWHFLRNGFRWWGMRKYSRFCPACVWPARRTNGAGGRNGASRAGTRPIRATRRTLALPYYLSIVFRLTRRCHAHGSYTNRTKNPEANQTNLLGVAVFVGSTAKTNAERTHVCREPAMCSACNGKIRAYIIPVCPSVSHTPQREQKARSRSLGQSTLSSLSAPKSCAVYSTAPQGACAPYVGPFPKSSGRRPSVCLSLSAIPTPPPLPLPKQTNKNKQK